MKKRRCLLCYTLQRRALTYEMEKYAMFPKTSKQVMWYAAIFAMQINIGTIPFLALTKMWTIGGIIITLNLLLYSWLGCTFLIGRADEKGWIQERVVVLKTIAILILLISGFALTTQLVLTDGIDDERQRKMAIAIGVGAVVIGLAVVFAVPRNRDERSQVAPRLRKGFAIATIAVGLFILFACYNWFKAIAN